MAKLKPTETTTSDAPHDQAVGSNVIPDVELAGFTVHKKARASVSASDPGAGLISADELARKQQSRMLLMIGGVSAALLLLVTGGIIALMSSGGQEEIVENGTPAVAANESSPPVTDPYAGAPPIVAVDAGLSTVAPSSALAGFGEVTAVAPAVANSPLAIDPSSAPGATDPASILTVPRTDVPSGPTAAPPSAAAIATVAPAAAPIPASGATATATPNAPLPAAALEAKPAEDNKESEKKPAPPTTVPTAEPKPESKAALPKKQSPPVPMFEIAAAVDLPRVPAADGSGAEPPTKVLGRINADPKAGCFITLLGGTRAMKGRTEFSLRSAQGGTAPRDWEFIAMEPPDTEILLAKLSLPQNELLFEWTPDGLQHVAATHLRNCALRITVGQEKPHTVALRTPQSEAPVTLAALEKSPVVIKFQIESLPDPAALRFEHKIADIKMALDPSAKTEAKGDQWIYLGEGGGQSLFHLRMATSSTAKGVQVTLTPYLVLPKEKPQRLTPALRKSLPVGALQEQKQLVEKRIAELAKLPRDQKLAERDEMSVRRKLLDENLLKLQQFGEVMQKLASAQLQMRVYYDAVETQIDLVRTEGGPASQN